MSPVRYAAEPEVRLTTIVAVILVAAWVLDWGWAANFGLIQLGLADQQL